jgi:hypothetical protein
MWLNSSISSHRKNKWDTTKYINLVVVVVVVAAAAARGSIPGPNDIYITAVPLYLLAGS